MNRRSNAQAALEKAKKLEQHDLEKGKRYVKVDARTYILVECDADGHPTKRGLESLDRHNVKLA